MFDFIKNTNSFFVAIIKILLLSRWRTNHKIYQTKKKEVIILCNGPSLSEALENESFIKRIENCDKVCVNHFHSSEFFTIVKPEYYIIAAPSLFQKSTIPEFIESRTRLYNDLANQVTWDMVLLMPFEAKKTDFWKKTLGKNDKIKILYFNITAYEGGPNLLNFIFNSKFGMPRLHNVCGPAIMNMIWLNYSEIYLTGVDHSWLPMVSVTEDNIALVRQPHFYDKDSKPETMNDRPEPRKLHEILHKFYVSFKGYFDIKVYVIRKKVNIINLTKGSYIDAFEKKPLSYFINKE